MSGHSQAAFLKVMRLGGGAAFAVTHSNLGMAPWLQPKIR
jgi:hypothetical protein